MRQVKEINFEDILPLWKTELWPGRESSIEAVSVIDHRGEINMELNKFTPYFWGHYIDGNLIGVVSGMQTSTFHFRSRGIWVQKEHRFTSVGTSLIKAVAEKGRNLGCRELWTMPRCDSWSFYEKCGFQIREKINKYEFGPHYLAFKSIQ